MFDRNSLIAIAAGLLLFLVASAGAWESTQWLGKPFPGFLLLGNRVVASAGGLGWPAAENGSIYQHEVQAVSGIRLEQAADLQQLVQSLPVGTELEYTLRFEDRIVERTIASRRFEVTDFLLLFGTYLLNGLVLGGCAVAILLRRSARQTARAVVPFLLISAGWALSAMDLYGPYRLFRLHAACESMLWASALHLALCYPTPIQTLRRQPGLVWLPYAVAGVLAAAYQWGLMDPQAYVRVHLLATSALGLSLIVLTLGMLSRYFVRAPAEVLAHLRILALGASMALTPVIVLTVAEALIGGRSSQNAIGFTSVLFFLSLGYAALRLPEPSPGNPSR